MHEHDLINAYKHATWAEIDLIRSSEDLASVWESKEKNPNVVSETQTRINEYKKVQKENQEFEQQIQDDHRQEEAQQEEVKPAVVDEEKVEQTQVEQP